MAAVQAQIVLNRVEKARKAHNGVTKFIFIINSD
jgi:hypothetical protein